MGVSVKYLAGIFDGEGCVHRAKNGRVWVKFSNTHRPTCELFLRFGGSVQRKEPPKKSHHKQCWDWVATGQAALLARHWLNPFLRLKRIPANVYRSLLLGIILLSLVGCVSVNVIPTDLPLPIMPEIQFVPSGDTICLSEPDANKLSRYLQQLDAFRQAWERLRTP